MSIYHFGDETKLVRESTEEELKACFKRGKVPANEKSRLEQHFLWTVRDVKSGVEYQCVDLAYLKATDGWSEILDTAAEIQPALRSRHW